MCVILHAHSSLTEIRWWVSCSPRVAITLGVMSAHHAERDGYFETDNYGTAHWLLVGLVENTLRAPSASRCSRRHRPMQALTSFHKPRASNMPQWTGKLFVFRDVYGWDHVTIACPSNNGTAVRAYAVT